MKKSDGSIRLSEKHGVNPTLGVCWWCLEDNGEIGLLGRLKGDAEAPRRAVLHTGLCPKCKELTKEGVILASVEDVDVDGHPVRSGCMVVIRREAAQRLGISPSAEAMLVRDSDWDSLGLPRGE